MEGPLKYFPLLVIDLHIGDPEMLFPHRLHRFGYSAVGFEGIDQDLETGEPFPSRVTRLSQELPRLFRIKPAGLSHCSKVAC